MKKLFSLIKKVMNTEEELDETPEVESEPVEQEEAPLKFEKCGCPENANKAQWQLDNRCMFCGKEFYSTILI